MTERTIKFLKGIISAAFGCVICYLHIIKWVPFQHFMNDAFQYAVTTIWAYIGGFMGVCFFIPLFIAIVEEFNIVEKLFYE